MLKRFAMRMAVVVLRVIYMPFRTMSLQNKITFISRQADYPSEDIRMLVDYINKYYSETECLVLAKRLEGAGKLSYAFHMLTQMRAVATSTVVVLDGYCIVASALRHKEETKIIQMWHALAAIKKFGYQTIDKPAGRSSDTARIMCMHRNYDYVISPGEETGKLLCQAFAVTEDKLQYYALPRVDRILQKDEEFAARVRVEYGIPPNTGIALYVPTFRRGVEIDTEAITRAFNSSDYRLVIKLHPVFDNGDPNADHKYSSYEWLKACDCVITDYSALGIEAALTGKPVYFYVPDIDNYEREVGLNINPEKEMPQATARTIEDLLTLLEEDYDYRAEREFATKYVSAPTENCTGRLGDFLWKLSKSI